MAQAQSINAQKEPLGCRTCFQAVRVCEDPAMEQLDRARQTVACFAAHLRNANAAVDSVEYERRFHELLVVLDQLAEAVPTHRTQLAAYLDELAGDSIDRGTFHWRSQHKPLGYSGDYEIIDWTYVRYVAANGCNFWDDFYHRQSAPQAVRNRKDYLVDLFGGMCRERGRGIRMLDIASGPCRDVAEALAAVGESGRDTHVHCVDIDDRAVTYARGIVAGLNHGVTFRWQVANALHLRLRETFDLVWSAGLFDYLDDRCASALLRRMWQWTAPGGLCVVGNFHPHNPSRLYMEWCGNWKLIHRSEQDLLRLAESAGIPADSLRLEKEPLGVVVFLLAERDR